MKDKTKIKNHTHKNTLALIRESKYLKQSLQRAEHIVSVSSMWATMTFIEWDDFA